MRFNRSVGQPTSVLYTLDLTGVVLCSLAEQART